MIYGKPVPRIDNILWLSKLASPYPATASRIREVAEEWKFNKGTLEFLKMYGDDEIFESRQQFIKSSKELEDDMYARRGAFIVSTKG